MDFFDDLTGLVAELEASHVEYALVGGLAVAVWGAPRATKDIDLLIEPEAVPLAKAAAARRGFTLPPAPLRFRDGVSVERVSRIDQGQLVTVDFMLVSANVEMAWRSRLRVATRHGPLWVASRDALIAMKLAAGRTQDIWDVERLQEIDR